MAHWEDIKAIAIDFIQLDSTQQALITENIGKLASRDLIRSHYIEKKSIIQFGIGKPVYDDYIAGNLTDWDTETLELAEACLMVANLFNTNMKLLKDIVRARYIQYGEGQKYPEGGNELEEIINQWRLRARDYVEQYQNSSEVKNGTDFSTPDIFGYSDLQYNENTSWTS
jgi:hypothetical protein